MKQDLVEALRLMSKSNDIVRDTHGNVSVRDGYSMHIKPSGMSYDKISLDDICTLDITETGVSFSNRRKPSVDTPHHLSIYKRYQSIGAICHTHSPYATGFAWAGLDIRCVGTEHADFFGDTIRTLVYQDMDSWGDNVYLKTGEKAVLLERHGVLTFADNPMQAVKLAIAVENCAMKLFVSRLASLAAGTCQSALSHEETKKWHDRFNGGGYGQ